MTLSIRAYHRSFSNCYGVQLFCTTPSSTAPDPDSAPENSSSPSSRRKHQHNQQSFLPSYYNEVKSSLRQKTQNIPQDRTLNASSQHTVESPATKFSSYKTGTYGEIEKDLSEFRTRSSNASNQVGGASSDFSTNQHISLYELYKEDTAAKLNDRNYNIESVSNAGAKSGSVSLSFEAIRESLRQLRSKTSPGIDRGRDSQRSLKLKPHGENESDRTIIIGGSKGLPLGVFGKDTKSEQGSKGDAMSTEFVKMYSYTELGNKLRSLRPEIKEKQGKNLWFSLRELNERLKNLRIMEEKDAQSAIGGFSFKDLRESLVKLRISDKEKAKNSLQRLNILGQLGGPTKFMELPPKEHLVDKYFLPVHMAAEDKLKLELARVREEFKMSESDCGSSRVQVAQLTTKIKYLSSTLHKKDKHSRRGLKGMVERRKKLLKYLRRTDWDSYTLVMSKLGLRESLENKYSIHNRN